MSDLPDLRCLRAFLEVARCGSVSGAAARLSLTQSAVSHALRDLQDQIGRPLLYRSGRGVRLTRQGELLQERLGRYLPALTAAVKEVAGSGEMDRGLLRIGCSATAARVILPSVLREFRESFPNWNISVRPGRTQTLVRALREGEADVVLSLSPGEVGGLEQRRLFEDDLHYLFCAGHAWASRGCPAAKDLARETLILVSMEGREFELIEEGLLKLGAQLRFPIQAGSVEVACELIKLNLGVGLMAPWSVASDLRSGALRSLPARPKITRQWVVATLAQRPLALAERTFLVLCEQAGADFALRHGLSTT